MKRMLFNATQQEELRVAIVNGQKLIDIDIETAGRELRKSNIYKGVITRIEPSLEACFVNYGEERHGFLPFKEVARSYFKEGVDVRNASIKEALREGQEIMVQVEKEERGNKGAALTSFISLAGRYLVLMPNNPRGGGVSRRVEGEDRQELRETMDKLDLPNGMSVIARTAGIGRNVDELQWDLNYLMQLWRAIEGAGKAAPGAFLIYQESSLVIRAIRDYFQPDIGEILIDTDDIYEQAQQFMSHVMPDMVHRVKRYSDDVPLFSRFQIEHQIETAYSRTVPLPSGGAIVIDHTEALVSVDVNSARATRGGDIETTALYTNLEAAEEVARQLRLRDLGGLIVIDFIDMENAKNQREVEQKLKDALRYDRARVQMGKISRFGLMELSRQRLRPSLSEGSHVTCPRCNGTGHIRDTESSALQVLRIIQEEAMKENSAAIHCQVPVDVAAFLLNEKRGEILKIETRHRVTVILIPNKHLETPHYKLERLKTDDPRLEDHHASYAMAEQVDTDIGYAKRQKEDIKPRQEAVVKSITPETAPIVERKEVPAQPAAPAAKPGFFARLFSFLFSAPETPAETSKKPEAGKDAERERQGRQPRQAQRNRNRKDRQREDRDEQKVAKAERHDKADKADRADKSDKADKPNDKAERAERGDKHEQNRAGGETQRQPKQPKAPREDKEARDGQTSETRRERQQRLRDEKKEAIIGEPRAEELPVKSAELADTLVPNEAELNPALPGDAESGEGEERRRRRRRGGRNRNRKDRDLNEAGENGEASLEAAETGSENESAQAGKPVFEPVADIAAAAVRAEAESIPATQFADAVSAPIAATSSAVAPAEALAVATQPPVAVQVSAPLATETAEVAAVTSAAAPAPVIAAAPSAPTVVAPVVAAPAVSTPVVAAPAAPLFGAGFAAPAAGYTMPLGELHAMLNAAGLELASTDPDKHQAAQQRSAQIVIAPRVPRERKPLPPVSAEALVQVETRR